MPVEDRFAQFRASLNAHSSIKALIAVCSGKGGVGKSLITSLLAINAQKAGLKVGIMDADVTGPSIPTIFGLSESAKGSENEIYPVISSTGIKVISLNCLNFERNAPVIWRGPILASIIKQFYTDVVWGDLDLLFVDMPPGTGDVPLTVFQSLPIKAAVVAASPQDLVSLIVEKAVKMAQMMDVPILGLVENMAYLDCPNCGSRLYPFGKPHAELAEKYAIPHYETLPIDPKLAEECDKGSLEKNEKGYLQNLSQAIAKLL